MEPRFARDYVTRSQLSSGARRHTLLIDMSYGTAFIILACAAALLTGGLMAAHARAGARGLALAGAGFAALCAGLVLWRDAVHGTGRPALSATLAIVAVAAGTGVIYLRRRSGRHLLTGTLAWIATLFAYFQLAFMLRPR